MRNRFLESLLGFVKLLLRLGELGVGAGTELLLCLLELLTDLRERRLVGIGGLAALLLAPALTLVKLLLRLGVMPSV